MAKATSLKLVPAISQFRNVREEKSEVLARVKANVEDAVSQLRLLGKDYEKAAWMLEDSLNFALSEPDKFYSTQGVDWASFIQAEELFEGRR